MIDSFGEPRGLLAPMVNNAKFGFGIVLFHQEGAEGTKNKIKFLLRNVVMKVEEDSDPMDGRPKPSLADEPVRLPGKDYLHWRCRCGEGKTNF